MLKGYIYRFHLDFKPGLLSELELLTFRALGLYVITNFPLICTDWIIMVPSFPTCVKVDSPEGK